VTPWAKFRRPSRSRIPLPCSFGDGVDGFAQQHVRSLHPCFGEGGVGVDGLGEFSGGELGANGRGGLRDKVRGGRPKSRRPQDCGVDAFLF
jgi:hypothetical protein